MKKNDAQLSIVLFFIILLIFLLNGCNSIDAPDSSDSGPSYTDPALPPSANIIIGTPNPAGARSQATIDTGQKQLADLARQSTLVSLSMSQAANAEAQSTQDSNQIQKAELDNQSTLVSLNVTQAAATQNAIEQGTEIASSETATALSGAQSATQSVNTLNTATSAVATAAAQSSAATVTQFAGILSITETTQAQADLETQVAKTSQAAAAAAVYPLTATPFTATQQALLMTEYGREQQNFADQVAAPLIPILASLDLVLLILVVGFSYPQLMRLTVYRRSNSPYRQIAPYRRMLIDSIPRDVDLRLDAINPRSPNSEETAVPNSSDSTKVEILPADKAPVDYWIKAIEHELSIIKGE